VRARGREIMHLNENEVGNLRDENNRPDITCRVVAERTRLLLSKSKQVGVTRHTNRTHCSGSGVVHRIIRQKNSDGLGGSRSIQVKYTRSTSL